MRRSVSWLRCISILTAVLVGLTAAVPVRQQRPEGPNEFPLAGLFALLTASAGWASDRPTVPQQQRGGPVDGPHTVSADATRANGGNGRAFRKVPGALDAYAAPKNEDRPEWTTPKARVGYVPGKSKWQSAGSTPMSDLYKNEDGTFTERAYQRPVNFVDADGTLRPIDSRLSRGRDGRWRTVAGPVTVSVAGFGGRIPATEEGTSAESLPGIGLSDLVSITLPDGQVLTYGLEGARLVDPQVVGSKAIYRDMLPSIDLEIVTTGVGGKETLVLKARQAANSWVFPMEFKGLTPRLEADGSVALLDQVGKLVASIPRGWMQDSKVQPDGEFTTSNAVSYELIAVDGKPTLKVTADRAWLDDPARVYPVRVDPTAQLWDDTGDVYVDATSVQSGTSLGVGCYDPDGAGSQPCNKRRSFLSFANFGSYAYGAPNNSLIGKRITGANLHLFHTWSEDCPSTRSVYAYRVTQSWSPTNMPNGRYPGASVGAAKIGEVYISNNSPACTNTSGNRSVGTWWDIPITDLTVFNDWSRGAPNWGIALSSDNDADPKGWKRFTSRDYDPGNGSYAPYIDFTWEENVAPQVNAQYPPSGYAAPTLTPELLVTATDDSYPNPMTYKFTVLDSAMAVVAESSFSSARNFVVPEGKLKWGQAYLWTVQVWDGKLLSTSQSWNALLTPAPQPLITSNLSQNSGGHGFEPAIGNYTTNVIDAQIATVGPPLAMQRFYNSRDPRSGSAFGSGWSSLLDAKAVETGSTVIVTYPSGQDVAFGRNPDGTFTLPPGRFATFQPIAGGYELIDKDGTKYSFIENLGSGKFGLRSITDAHNRALSLAYTSGKVTLLTSASGRKLGLTWSGAHVATVFTDRLVASDPASANTWQYTYSGDKLAKVCPPTSATACTTYSYGTNSLHPTAVLDAGPHTYLRLNEAAGTATAASSALDNVDTATASYTDVTLGQTGPLSGSTSTAAGFNGTSSQVELQKKTALSAAYQTVSMWFKTAPGGSGVLYSRQVSPLPDVSGGGWNPSLYIGTDGKLRGEFWNGSAAPITSTPAVNDGNWHHVALTAAGNTQSLFLDGIQVGSALSGLLESQGETYFYVGAGKWANWPGSSASAVSYFNGTISDFAFYTRPLSSVQVKAIRDLGVAASTPLTVVTRPSGGISAQVQYDGAAGTTTQVTDANGGIWKIGKPFLSGTGQAYASAVMAAAPVDYYRMKETGVTTAVNEVNGNAATYNQVTLGVGGGPVGDKVAGFNGISSYLELSAKDKVTTGPNSVSMWFKTTASGVLYSHQTNVVTDVTTPGGWNPALYVGTDGKLRGKFWTGNATPITSATAVNDGNWHYVVLAASTDSQTLYLDGAQVGDPLAGTIAPNGCCRAYVGTGKWTNWQGTTGDVGYFNGQISDFAFYNTELSQEQVAAQFAARDQASGVGVASKTVKTTDPGNKTISDIYDLSAGGRQIEHIDARGGRTVYGYDTRGFLRTTTDPNGNMLIAQRDARGNVLAQTTCQDRSENICSTVYSTYTQDAVPKVLTIRDGRSASDSDNTYLTSYTYDAKGNVTLVKDPLGRETKTDYTDGTTGAPAGLPWRVTSPNGGVQTITYLASGDVSQSVDAAGLTIQFTYDALGRLSQKTVGTGFWGNQSTSMAYDRMGRLVTQTDPTATDRVTGAEHTQVTTTVYDIDGNVISLTASDASSSPDQDLQRTATMTYNALGQRTKLTDAMGFATEFTFDAFGRLIQKEGPDETIQAVAYDETGNQISSTVMGWTGDPNAPSAAIDLLVESRAYDPAGRLASVTDAEGWQTLYAYTDNNLVAKITRRNPANGATFVQEDNGYDAAGNLIRKVTNNGVTVNTFIVDPASRPTSSTVDPSGVNRSTTYTYGPDNKILTVKTSDGSGASHYQDFTYDLMGRKTSESVRTPGATAARGWWKLDETAGLASADSSGGNKTATAASGVSWSSGAAVFNGGGAMQTAGPVLDNTKSVTVTAWAKVDDLGESRVIAAQDGENTQGFSLQYSQTANRWAMWSSSADSTSATQVSALSTTPPQVGQWTQLVGVIDRYWGKMRLYVNGQLEAEVTAPSAYHANGPFVVGRGNWDGPCSYFKGSIDNLQAYQRALTAAQVSALYAEGRTGAAVASPASTTTWSLSLDGLPWSQTDAEGNTTTFDFDERGRLTETNAPISYVETNGSAPVYSLPTTDIGYNTFGEQTRKKDSQGEITKLSRDKNGLVVSTMLPSYTPPGGNAVVPISTITYDSMGRVSQRQDPLGGQTSYVYDQLGRLAKTTNADGKATKFTYDLLGGQRSITDASGAQTLATYDYLGRTLTETEVVRQPATASFTTSYQYIDSGPVPSGWMASETRPGRASTTYGYNSAGEVTSATDGLGNDTSYAYDFAGRQVATTLDDGSKQTVDLNPLGKPVTNKSLSPTGTVLAQTSASFDATGQMLTSTDANGSTSTYFRDSRGLVSRMVQPVSGSEWIITSFGYDGEGRRTRFTDGRGSSFITTYNSWGLQESKIEPATAAHPDPADRTTTTVYDIGGRQTELRSPGGAKVSYAYDVMGRLASATGTGAEVTTAERTFGYDDVGRMTSVSGTGGVNTLSYDDRGLLLSTSGPSGTSSFTWTDDALMASRQDAAGITSYAYDQIGRLQNASNAAADIQNTYAYNNLSQVASITSGTSNNVRSLGYDGLRRLVTDELKTAGGASLGKITYGWDLNGNETSKTTVGFAGSASNTYTYDHANRLTSWNNGSSTQSYAYDKSGNRTSVGAKTFTYDQRNRLLASPTDGTTYEYTARGTLRRATTGTVGRETLTDAFGQITRQQSGDTTYSDYTYDGLGRVVQSGFTYSGLGNTLAQDLTAKYVRGPDGKVLGVQAGGNSAYAWTDLHTDLVGQFTATGANLSGSTAYDPFGKTLASSGMLGSLGFQSEWTDQSTKRVNMHSRWYNPDTGQFDTADTMSLDPVPASVSANRYAYGNANPLVNTDPTGHCPTVSDFGDGQTVHEPDGLYYTYDCSWYYSEVNKPAGERFQTKPDGKSEAPSGYVAPYTSSYVAPPSQPGDDCFDWYECGPTADPSDGQAVIIYPEDTPFDAFLDGLYESTIGVIPAFGELFDQIKAMAERHAEAINRGEMSYFDAFWEFLEFCFWSCPGYPGSFWNAVKALFSDVKTVLLWIDNPDNGVDDVTGSRALGRLVGLILLIVLTDGVAAEIRAAIAGVRATAEAEAAAAAEARAAAEAAAKAAARRTELAKDPDHNFKVSPKSYQEADVALALEANGKVPGPVTRDQVKGRGDFVDGTGQVWDVKGFHSGYANGYDLVTALGKIQESIGKGEYVMLDTTKMTQVHIDELFKAVNSDPSMAGKIVWYP